MLLCMSLPSALARKPATPACSPSAICLGASAGSGSGESPHGATGRSGEPWGRGDSVQALRDMLQEHHAEQVESLDVSSLLT